jgi:hypothetical protein
MVMVAGSCFGGDPFLQLHDLEAGLTLLLVGQGIGNCRFIASRFHEKAPFLSRCDPPRSARGFPPAGGPDAGGLAKDVLISLELAGHSRRLPNRNDLAGWESAIGAYFEFLS